MLSRVTCRSVASVGRSVGVAPRRSLASSPASSEPATMSPEMQKYTNTKAYLFSEKPPAPGQRRKWQHWESSFYLLAGGTLAAIWVFKDRPNTRVTDWAKDEAEERMRRREAGLSVQYGVNYAMLKAMGKEPDAQEAAHAEDEE